MKTFKDIPELEDIIKQVKEFKRQLEKVDKMIAWLEGGQYHAHLHVPINGWDSGASIPIDAERAIRMVRGERSIIINELEKLGFEEETKPD